MFNKKSGQTAKATPENSELETKNKQLALKIEYLTEEIKSLREKSKNYQDALKLNLETLSSFKISDNKQQSSFCSNELNTKGTKKTGLGVNSDYQNMIESLTIENRRLYEIIQATSQDCDKAKSKALVYEQISEEVQRREQETIKEYEEKTNKLMTIINEKETIILKYEKTTEALDVSNNIIKYKYVCEPNEQSMLLHQEANSLKKSLKACVRHIKQLKCRNVEHMNINYKLSNEIINLRKSKPLKRKDQSPTHYSNKSLDDFYSKLFDQQEKDNDFLSPLNSPLPEKIVHNASHLSSSPAKRVPKLDLTKAFKIQEYNAKRNFQNQSSINKDNEAKYLEKLKQFDNELTRCKKALQKEMCDNKILADQLNDAEIENKALKEKISTILKSQKIYEFKYQKMYYYLNFYQKSYSKYLNLIKIIQNSKKDFNKSLIELSSQRNEKYDELERRMNEKMRNDKKVGKSPLFMDFKEEDHNIESFKSKTNIASLYRTLSNYDQQSVFKTTKPSLYSELSKTIQSSKKKLRTYPLSLEIKFLEKLKKKSKLYRNNSEILEKNFLLDFKIAESLLKFTNDDNNIFLFNESEFELSKEVEVDEAATEVFVFNKLQNPFLTTHPSQNHLGAPKPRLNFYSSNMKDLDMSCEFMEEDKKKVINYSFISNEEIFF